MTRRWRAGTVAGLCAMGFLFNMLRGHDRAALDWELTFLIIVALFPEKK